MAFLAGASGTDGRDRGRDSEAGQKAPSPSGELGSRFWTPRDVLTLNDSFIHACYAASMILRSENVTTITDNILALLGLQVLMAEALGSLPLNMMA